MEKLLLLALLVTGTLCTQSCSKKNDPTSPNQLIQGSWQLVTIETTTEPIIGGTPTKPITGGATTIIKGYTRGDVVSVWTATTVEEYLLGKSQGAVAYTISGDTLTTKTTQGVANTAQILTLTKDVLKISKAQNTTSTEHLGSSIVTVICNYVK